MVVVHACLVRDTHLSMFVRIAICSCMLDATVILTIMAFIEIMRKFNGTCVFETVLHMAFIEIMRIKGLFSVCIYKDACSISGFPLAPGDWQ